MITFANAQQTVADMVAFQASTPGSVLAGLKVVKEAIDEDTAKVADPALRNDGAVLMISIPDGGGSMANRESNYYYIAVYVALLINPMSIKSGLNVDPMQMVDELIDAPGKYAEEVMGGAIVKPGEVPVERIDEAMGFLLFTLQYSLPVLK